MDKYATEIDVKRENDGYNDLLNNLSESFKNLTGNLFRNRESLFRVNVEGLWDVFLNNIPEDARQHYDCRACRHFVERYGNLVTVKEDGHIESALWNIDVPEFFQPSLDAMNRIVRKEQKVNGIFVSDILTLGTPVTGVWHHLSVELPRGMANNSRLRNAEQVAAEKREEFRMLINALQEYPLDIVEQAVSLLETNAMYRSDRVIGIAKWFKELHESIEGVNGTQRNNLIWKAVSKAPTGFCHIKSSMIGTLLDDIKAGYSTRVVMARFEEKMNPQNYMRSQSAPTASAIEQAEKLVEKLGIADSLRRKYARFEDISKHCNWMPRPTKIEAEKKTGGVFANVTPKEKLDTPNSQINMPTTVMTYDKFCKTVLSTADKIEVLIDNPNRFMALVTEAVEGSENILQWNNPYSWYYHGGIDGEIKRRVESAGGRYEDCEIRCSLIWGSTTDLDLHCITPSGRHIDWHVRRHNINGGMLDVDANGCDQMTDTPVENIRWISNAPNGHYRFYVHNYSDRNNRNNPYKVELEVGGKIYTYNGFMARTDERETVFEFDYENGKVLNMRTGNSTITANSETWNLQMNNFVNVKGIVNSPNTWDKKLNDGYHVFFLLDNCMDTSEGKGRGFFNEILKPELREIRKTLEVYSANTPIEDASMADACGVGYLANSDWDLTVRVTSGKNTRVVKIDRFD